LQPILSLSLFTVLLIHSAPRFGTFFGLKKVFFCRIPFQGKTPFLNPPWESDKVVESMNRTFKACRQWSRYFMPIIYREKTFLLVSKLFSLSIFMRIVPRLTLAK
jgi:hypothetical protein